MLVLLLSFAVALLDQVTKHLVRSRIHLGERVPVISGFFDLRYVRNTGAAWGILAGSNHWLIGLSIVMLAVIVFFRRHFMSDDLVSRASIGLILGGIVGNLLDRVRLSYVVDFLDVYWRGHHFPAFNVADSAICVGVFVYVAAHVLRGMRGSAHADSAASA